MSKVSPMSASIANALIEKSVRMKEKEKRATFWGVRGRGVRARAVHRRAGRRTGGPADCGGRKEDKKKEKKKRNI